MADSARVEAMITSAARQTEMTEHFRWRAVERRQRHVADVLEVLHPLGVV